jgi:hypothetical protein
MAQKVLLLPLLPMTFMGLNWYQWVSGYAVGHICIMITVVDLEL